jgi:hypothetical protein
MLLLLVFTITILISKKNPNYILLAILILLLADLNSSGTIFAGCITLYCALKTYFDYRGEYKKLLEGWNFRIGLTTIIIGSIILGFFFKIYLFKLAKNLAFEGGIPPFYTAITSILNAYLPIPDLSSGTSFWSTHLFPFQWVFPPGYKFQWMEMTFSIWLSTVLSLLIICIVTARLWTNKLVLAIYFLNSIILIVFFMYGMKAFPSRYLGLLFLVFLYCYWLYKDSLPNPVIEGKAKQCEGGKETKITHWSAKVSKAFQPLLIIVFLAQILSTCYALNVCNLHKFTLSQDAAAFIKWNCLQNNHVLVGYPDYAAQCVSAHLDQKIFYPQQNRFAYSAGDFLDGFKRSLPASELFSSCLNFTEGEGKNVLLILNFPIMTDGGQILEGPAMISKKSSITLIKAITGDVVNKDEQYWLYEVCKVR